MTGETVLYHEYAHHFMIASLTSRAYPRWFTEGFAEFFAGVRFKEDGTVLLGAPAQHRAAELVYALEVPIRTLLSFDGGAQRTEDPLRLVLWPELGAVPLSPDGARA